jgi:hypothetical protein
MPEASDLKTEKGIVSKYYFRTQEGATGRSNLFWRKVKRVEAENRAILKNEK